MIHVTHLLFVGALPSGRETVLQHRNELGFTLIEVIVVCAVIGILSGISLQIFIELRTRSFDSRANSDIRNVAAAEEAYFAEVEHYLSCNSAESCSMLLPGIPNLSTGVSLAISATTSGFTGTSSHPKGSGIVYRWENKAGGMSN